MTSARRSFSAHATRAPAPPAALPCYELRARQLGPGNAELEVWQVPSPATPHLERPLRVAGLHGRNLALVEHRLVKRLHQARIDPAGLPLGDVRAVPLEEDLALNLGLLFRVLAPMRDRDNMCACAEGIEAMGREEAAYWLGMAMHRRNPRRVLMALRFLLTGPKPRKRTGA